MKFNIDYGQHTTPCVVIVKAASRYIILKCKSLKTTTSFINKMIVQHKRNKNIKEDNLLYHFIKYVSRQKVDEADVEVVAENCSEYELLVAEQSNLDEYCYDKNCLNNTFDAYIPEYNDLTGSYGWIPRHAVLNFQKWRKAR